MLCLTQSQKKWFTIILERARICSPRIMQPCCAPLTDRSWFLNVEVFLRVNNKQIFMRSPERTLHLLKAQNVIVEHRAHHPPTQMNL